METKLCTRVRCMYCKCHEKIAILTFLFTVVTLQFTRKRVDISSDFTVLVIINVFFRLCHSYRLTSFNCHAGAAYGPSATTVIRRLLDGWSIADSRPIQTGGISIGMTDRFRLQSSVWFFVVSRVYVELVSTTVIIFRPPTPSNAMFL